MSFISEISVYWLIPWAFISILMSYFLYSKSKWFSGLHIIWKSTLRITRALLFFLIGVLLLDVIFEMIHYDKEKPILITITDNSSSLNNYSDSLFVKTQILNTKKEIKKEFANDYEIVEMTTGEVAKYNSEINLKESKSNLESVFSKIASDFFNRNIGGLVFISDGNFNTGSNPIYNTSQLNFAPIFSLGVGDTIVKKDQYIKNVSTNEIAFLGNQFPVEVDIEAVKFEKGSTYKVSLMRDNKVLQSQKIVYDNNERDFKQLNFLLNADQVGFQSYSVSVSNAENEINYVNNKRTFYVEVLDSRNKILILSGAPHPDVSAVKNVLELNENIEVVTALASSWDKKLDYVDLVIWHDPHSGFDIKTLEYIQSFDKPILFFISPNTSSNTINKIGIGIGSSNRTNADEVQGALNMDFKSFELSDNFDEFINNAPPLNSKFGKLLIKKPLDILMYQKIGSVSKKDPLIYFLKHGSVKYGVVYGVGVWKWKMNEYSKTNRHEKFNELIEKLTGYLVVKKNNSPLRISIPNRFTKDEEVIINASFYNSSFESITTPKIKLTLIDSKKSKSNLEFSIYGDAYKLNMGTLSPGKYTWNAETKFDNKIYKKSGVFLVQDISLENRDTYANHSLLNELSEKTNGAFFKLSESGKMIQSLKKRKDISSVSHKTSLFKHLIDFKLYFLTLIVLVSIEWFVRRFNGSY
ncbi:MAG: hypothetical protein CL824_05790 [Crocinitomicaceae bacterium]|nr:hypothetical protein [Crocinitomicaceae bacterium]